MKVIDFESIVNGMEFKLVATYLGYESHAMILDSFVGEFGKVAQKDYQSVLVQFPPRDNIIDTCWWYPPYSLEFPGDDKSLTINDVKVNRIYTIGHKLNTFRESRYSENLKDIDIDASQLNDNFISAQHCQLSEKVKVLQIIPIRTEFNDILVWCEHTVSKKNTLLPLTCLYYDKPVPLYMKSSAERKKRFVYEYKDWENKR